MAHLFMKKHSEFDTFNDDGNQKLYHESKVITNIKIVHHIQAINTWVPHMESIGILFCILGIRLD